MTHVHGAAGAMKVAGAAPEMAKGAMDQAMMGRSVGETMGPMMSTGEMGGMMGGHMMANMPMMSHGAGSLAKGALAAGAMGVAASTMSNKRGGVMSSLARHPWLVFGLGVAAGVLIHKYRKEIIGTATQAAEKGKDFLLQQRENLEDLMAECREGEEAAAQARADRPRAGKPKAGE